MEPDLDKELAETVIWTFLGLAALTDLDLGKRLAEGVLLWEVLRTHTHRIKLRTTKTVEDMVVQLKGAEDTDHLQDLKDMVLPLNTIWITSSLLHPKIPTGTMATITV